MMKLRTFTIFRDQAGRLSEISVFEDKFSNEIVSEFLDAYFQNPEIPSATIWNDEDTILRSFYLTPEQDDKLKELAAQYDVTVGNVFRTALYQGMGKAK